MVQEHSAGIADAPRKREAHRSMEGRIVVGHLKATTSSSQQANATPASASHRDDGKRSESNEQVE